MATKEQVCHRFLTLCLALCLSLRVRLAGYNESKEALQE